MWKKIIFETLCICRDVTENKIEICVMKFKNLFIILLLFFIPGTILTKFYIYYIQWYFDINKHLNSTNSSSQFCRSVIPS